MQSAGLFLMGTILLLQSCAPDNSTTGDDRDQFVGSWTCRDSSKTSGDVQPLYSVNITKVGADDTIKITNFYNLGGSTSVKAIVSSTSLVIPSQNDDGFLISGSGVLSNSALNINYSATLGSNTDNGQARYTR